MQAFIFIEDKVLQKHFSVTVAIVAELFVGPYCAFLTVFF